MVIVGTAIFGSAAAGRAFMLIEALTVFLALIGTTLACLNTGARVTYAMGRDEEVPEHFGMLHGEKLTPHRAIWTLAVISAIIGIITVTRINRRTCTRCSKTASGGATSVGSCRRNTTRRTCPR